MILQYLQKRLAGHINSFKEAVKIHAENVELRNKRVGSKYGQASHVTLNQEVASKYALFSSANSSDKQPHISNSGTVEVYKQQELRNRRAPQSQSSSIADSVGGGDGDGSGVINKTKNDASRDVHSVADQYENDKKYGKGFNGTPSVSESYPMKSAPPRNLPVPSYSQQTSFLLKPSTTVDTRTRLSAAEKAESSIAQVFGQSTCCC